MQGRGNNIGSALVFEFTPAAIFGSAVGFSTARILALPPLGVTPAAAGAAAFGIIWLALAKFASRKSQFPMSDFDQSEFERELAAAAELAARQADSVEPIEDEADELLLDEVLAPPAPEPAEVDELVLDQIVSALDPASRVVRLFQPNDTAGEMQARIENHLRTAPRQVPPDATKELHEALAALRRSLR